MSIIINGLDMPKDYGICIVIYPDGRVTGEYSSLVIAKAASKNTESEDKKQL